MTIRRPVPFDTGPVHFVGIGGIGMSGIAEVMLNLGKKTFFSGRLLTYNNY